MNVGGNALKMKLQLNNRTINFQTVKLTIIKRDIENPFYDKNNKTLKETFAHKKYQALKTILSTKYHNSLNDKLGDFLKNLKSSGDSDYKCFLNKYGDNKYCEFKIQSHLTDKGIYCFSVDNEIKYIGRCVDNFNKRINDGYGKIHPKNCFIDGQATNCHINSILNKTDKFDIGVYVMTKQSNEKIKELEKFILTCNRFEWNIQTS